MLQLNFHWLRIQAYWWIWSGSRPPVESGPDPGLLVNQVRIQAYCWIRSGSCPTSESGPDPGLMLKYCPYPGLLGNPVRIQAFWWIRSGSRSTCGSGPDPGLLVNPVRIRVPDLWSGSGYSSTFFLWLKFKIFPCWKEFIFLNYKYKLIYSYPRKKLSSYKRRIRPPKKYWTHLHFFLLLWVIFACLDPDPVSHSGSVSTGPIKSRIQTLERG